MSSIFRTAPNFSPDGFAAARPARDHSGLKYAVAATERERVVPARGADHASQGESPNYLNQDGYDEGLVHSHGWACH